MFLLGTCRLGIFVEGPTKFALKLSFLKFSLRAFAKELWLETRLCSRVQITRFQGTMSALEPASKGVAMETWPLRKRTKTVLGEFSVGKSDIL